MFINFILKMQFVLILGFSELRVKSCSKVEGYYEEPPTINAHRFFSGEKNPAYVEVNISCTILTYFLKHKYHIKTEVDLPKYLFVKHFFILLLR